MRELVVPAQGQFDGNAKCLDGHDRNGADGRADRDVDERVLLPIHRSYPVNHHGRVDGHCQTIAQEAYNSSAVVSPFPVK